MRPWTPLPLLELAHKAVRREQPEIHELADRSWNLSDVETTPTPRAIFLPGQLERITGQMYSSDRPGEEMIAQIPGVHLPTRAFLLKNAWLIDGALYKGNGIKRLHPRTGRLLQLTAEREVERGAMYSSYMGVKFFGNWLMDDCVAYPLAAQEGTPYATAWPIVGHQPVYEEWLDMAPVRTASAFFRELVVFLDLGHNEHKRRRFSAMRDKLLSREQTAPHPGVFLLRGRAGQGQPRLMENELELAEQLKRTRGFRVLDPTQVDVATIVRTCGQARVVIGVEGSGLVHGIVLLGAGGSLVTLQPPDRFCTVYKYVVDREGRHFAFVVGLPRPHGFYIDPDEVERTLDLLPAPAE